MQLMFIFIFVLGVIIHGVCTATQPRLTIITLHESKRLTWEDALNTCKATGQSLLTIKTPEKKTMISDLDRKHFNNHMFDTQYWTGMRKNGPSLQNCSDADFYWVDDGSKLDWGEFYPGEPNDCDIEYCIRIQNLLLRTRTCDIPYYFICEEVLDECTFETFNNSVITQEHVLLIPSQVITMETNSRKSSCLETCLDTVVDGAFCQAVTMNVTSCECVLFFSKYTEFSDIQMVADTDHVTYVKQCFLVFNESTTRVSYDDICHTPGSTYPSLVPTDTISTTPAASTSADITTADITTADVTTTDVTTADDTTTDVTTTDATTADATTADVTTTDATTAGVTTTNTSYSEPSTIIPTCPTINQNISSASQSQSLLPTSGLNLAMNISSCAINVSWELPPNADMQFIMKRVNVLKRELEILKNNTNMYRRGKVSWYDNRVSSKSLGGLGASLLATFCILIVCIDINSFHKRKKIMSGLA